MKNSRIFFHINKATNKGLEEQTVDKVIDMEDFINKTEEALRLLIKWQKLELLKSLKIPGFQATKMLYLFTLFINGEKFFAKQYWHTYEAAHNCKELKKYKNQARYS